MSLGAVSRGEPARAGSAVRTRVCPQVVVPQQFGVNVHANGPAHHAQRSTCTPELLRVRADCVEHPPSQQRWQVSFARVPIIEGNEYPVPSHRLDAGHIDVRVVSIQAPALGRRQEVDPRAMGPGMADPGRLAIAREGSRGSEPGVGCRPHAPPISDMQPRQEGMIAVITVSWIALLAWVAGAFVLGTLFERRRRARARGQKAAACQDER